MKDGSEICVWEISQELEGVVSVTGAIFESSWVTARK